MSGSDEFNQLKRPLKSKRRPLERSKGREAGAVSDGQQRLLEAAQHKLLARRSQLLEAHQPLTYQEHDPLGLFAGGQPLPAAKVFELLNAAADIRHQPRIALATWATQVRDRLAGEIDGRMVHHNPQVRLTLLNFLRVLKDLAEEHRHLQPWTGKYGQAALVVIRAAPGTIHVARDVYSVTVELHPRSRSMVSVRDLAGQFWGLDFDREFGESARQPLSLDAPFLMDWAEFR